MAVKTKKLYDGEWTVWNTNTMKTAEIIVISEYSLLPTTKKYRVDQNGKTIASCLEHFQTAKSIAMKAVK